MIVKRPLDSHRLRSALPPDFGWIDHRLLRDGYFTIHPDLTLKPNKSFTRAKLLRLIRQIYEKKGWMPQMLTGEARPTADGKSFSFADARLGAAFSCCEIIANTAAFTGQRIERVGLRSPL